MASPILKLEQGGDTLDINAGRYCVEESVFTPPTTTRSVRFGRSTTGSEFSSERRENRRWTVELNIKAASIAETERAIRDLQAFLNRAGKSRSEPLYIAYRSYNDYDFEPYFGQFGAFSRYEVVDANAMVRGRNYLNTVTNSNIVVGVEISMVIKPQARGIDQRVGQAKGTLIEDVFGGAGDVSGTIVAGAATNNFTNPIFMNSTYDTGWTLGPFTNKYKNTNPKYVLFGSVSTRVDSTGIGIPSIYQNLTLAAVTQYFSAYVKAEDGASVALVTWRYGANTLSTTRTAVGDGWYRITASAVGTGAAADTGLIMGIGEPLYVDGFQVTTTQHYPLIYGDLLGCSWASTAHASASTSTAGGLKYKADDFKPYLLNYTVRIVWKPPAGSAGTRYFIEDDRGDFIVYIDGSDQVFVQTVASNTVTTSALSLSAETPVVLHVTVGNINDLIVYGNGSSIGSNLGASVGTTKPTLFHIGSDNSATPANHCLGTLMDVSVFPQFMSAAEVLADYNQITQQAADSQRVSALPYLWTKDGDDVIDNEQSATDRNFGFLAGLMGDDVETEVYGKNSDTYDNTHGLLIGSLPIEPDIINARTLDDEDADALFFVDGAGTADTDANNGAAEQQSVNTAALEFVDTAEQDYFYPLVRGEEIYAFAVVKDAGSDLQLRAVVNLGSEKLYSEWRNVTASGAYYGFLLGPVNIPDNPRILDAEQKIGFAVEAKRSVAGAANLDVSHAVYMTNATWADASKMQTPSGADAMYIRAREVVAVLSSGSTTAGLGRIPLMPRPVKIDPNKINALMIQMGADGQTWDPDLTCDFDKISITPLWDIY